MTTSIAIGILALWAVLATSFLISARRALNTERRLTISYKNRMEAAYANAESWKRLADARKTPRDGSGRTITGPVKPAATVPSLKRFLSTAQSPATSRNDSTDTLNTAVIGSTLYTGPGILSDTPSPSSSPDTSSGSSDGGSCGGGE